MEKYKIDLRELIIKEIERREMELKKLAEDIRKILEKAGISEEEIVETVREYRHKRW